MTYDQTMYLIDSMNDLEMFAKLHGSEMGKDDIDWNAVGRYRDFIDVNRRAIFNMVNEGTD